MTQSDDDNAIITLISCDNYKVNISKEAAKISILLQTTMGDDSDCDSDSDSLNSDDDIEAMNEETDSSTHKEIPLRNVQGNVLTKVIEFCNYYHISPMPEIITPLTTCQLDEIVTPWYVDFITKLEWTMLQDLVLAANYMDITPLLRLSILAVSLKINGKTVDAIKPMLGIASEFSSGESTSHEKISSVEEKNTWYTHYINAEVSSIQKKSNQC